MQPERLHRAEAGERRRMAAVLTPPLSLDAGLAAEHRRPNLMQRVFGLFRNMRPGSDLTHFQLSPLFNMPKSQLQCYGEAVYCINEDILSKCSEGMSSLERFTSIVSWSISTTRPVVFGLTPFNPILGETHHVSRGSLNVLLEQVSHHPPVSALHATDTAHNLELLWCQCPMPKFSGTSVEAAIQGRRQVKLLNHGEVYEMNAPNLVIKLFPTPSADWSGNVRIKCQESGLEAEICYYRSHSFLGFGGKPRSVKGTIFHMKSLKTIYEIQGQWDGTVTLKDVKSGKVTTLYNAKKAISNLNTPELKDPERLLSTESALVWAEVSQGILSRSWDSAREAKRCIEEEKRSALERKANGEEWSPKNFTLSITSEGGWECWPKELAVPPAPIIVL